MKLNCTGLHCFEMVEPQLLGLTKQQGPVTHQLCVSYPPLQGMRKRVGFQYNADEDTVDDIAVEMLENLSLMPQQVSDMCLYT